MLETLERGWRVLATGACFLAFGLGSLLLGAVAFPILRLLVRDRARRLSVARRIIGRTFRCFVGMMQATGVITLDVIGAERLGGGGRLILANHPTLIDIVLLLSFMDRGDCVVKASLGRNPVTRGTVRGAGFVFNDGGGEDLLADCLRSVRAGNNLVIFPEGTRTARGEPMRLQRGAARVAVHGELDITPVRIHCTPATLAKGDRWWRVPRRRAHFRIEVGELIAVSPFIDGAPTPALAARRLTNHLTDYFSRERELAIA